MCSSELSSPLHQQQSPLPNMPPRQQPQPPQQQQQGPLAAHKVAMHIEMVAKAKQQQQQQQHYAMNGVPMNHPRMGGPMPGQMQMMGGPRGPQVMQAMQQGPWRPGMQNPLPGGPQVPAQQRPLAPQAPQGAPAAQQAQLTHRPLLQPPPPPPQQAIQPPGIIGSNQSMPESSRGTDQKRNARIAAIPAPIVR